MNTVITDVTSVNGSFDITRMTELRESLACVQSLSQLFPDDFQSSVEDMIKIATDFLNHSADSTQGGVEQQEI